MSDLDFVCRLLVLAPIFVLDPFAPLFVLAWALRLGLVADPYLASAQFSGFAGDEFLAVISVLYVAHILMDKVPLIAHLLDGIGLLVKPAAMAFAGLWIADRLDAQSALHWATLVIVLAGGVPMTFGLQALRTKVRLGASVGTLGVAHPAISTAETVAGGVLSYLAVTHPAAALVIVLLIGLPIIWVSMVTVRAVGRVAGAGVRHLRSRNSRGVY
jgi:hypothetical protein